MKVGAWTQEEGIPRAARTTPLCSCLAEASCTSMALLRCCSSACALSTPVLTHTSGPFVTSPSLSKLPKHFQLHAPDPSPEGHLADQEEPCFRHLLCG